MSSCMTLHKYTVNRNHCCRIPQQKMKSIPLKWDNDDDYGEKQCIAFIWLKFYWISVTRSHNSHSSVSYFELRNTKHRTLNTQMHFAHEHIKLKIPKRREWKMKEFCSQPACLYSKFQIQCNSVSIQLNSNELPWILNIVFWQRNFHRFN